ncbi:MAG: FAD-dependent oxidoreductase, partial [Betaproteobacteria bacterium]
HHPCESACNRAGYDSALAICKLERTVGDIALERGWAFEPPRQELHTHVAIVGGGPSGLSAAYQLRRRGLQVSLFEGRSTLGGLMRHGIPPYRLARDVLDGEIGRIVALGVQVHTHHAIATSEELARLRARHDAVYLAPGAQRPRRLAQLPEQAPWLMDSARYLALANDGHAPALGRHIAVIGGGSAALDVARSARRAGHDVTIIALEAAARMPAQHEELVEAREEGITLIDSAMLSTVQPQPGGGLLLECQPVHFEAGSTRGQFTISPLALPPFSVQVDAIISAVGQEPELDGWADGCARAGGLLQTDTRQATSADGVWAGGDVSSMARFVTEAIGMGKHAAIDIARRLQLNTHAAQPLEAAMPANPKPTTRDDAARPQTVTLERIATTYHPPAARVTEDRLAPAERLASGDEVQLPLSIQQALDEAERCFSCGQCTHCDNCLQYCPDLAITRTDGGYAVLSDYCKGCGICVAECPTGSMLMQEELR